MRDSLDIRVTDVRTGIAHVRARLPFRFGNTTIRSVAKATVEVSVETRDGRQAKGYAADFLSYAWFDKRPGRTPDQGSRDLLACIERAGAAWRDAPAAPAFVQWRDLHPGLEQAGLDAGQNRLSANFGVSMIERGVIDAAGQLTGQRFHDLIRGTALGIDEPSVLADLAPGAVRAALPDRPLPRIALRHTVGLVDPLTATEIAEPIGDGLPETLAEYLSAQGLTYLKLKISGDADETLARLGAIAALLDGSDRTFSLTLDGNEQFPDIASFAALVERIRATPALEQLWRAVLFVEQPVERSAALDGGTDTAAMTAIGKPLIIDESDGWTTAFREAMELGYRGVSHKNCKGVFRSFLNNALAAHRNATAGAGHYFLSAEDLSCLPLVSLNADLAAAASLGIRHIERNGHHYFSGLDHLSASEQQTAADYGGLYRNAGGHWSLAVHEGEIDVSGLSRPGFGLSASPDMNRLEPPGSWQFDADGDHRQKGPTA